MAKNVLKAYVKGKLSFKQEMLQIVNQINQILIELCIVIKILILIYNKIKIVLILMNFVLFVVNRNLDLFIKSKDKIVLQLVEIHHKKIKDNGFMFLIKIKYLQILKFDSNFLNLFLNLIKTFINFYDLFLIL